MKKSLYIFSQGKLARKDNTLCFETEQGKKHIPVEDTSDIFVFGEADINKKLLEFLSQKEILMHYFNYHGYYMGTFYPREHLNSGHIILQQASNYIDHDKRIVIARKFVQGALQNILQVLNYYNNRGKDVKEKQEKVRKLLENTDSYQEISQLMALEGNAREQYYGCFDSILENSSFTFGARSKRPPHNELNSLISFGNTMLYTVVLSEIYKTHLDPRIGFLHATNFRRFSLNLDIAEIFKPIIIDRIIFKLLAKKMITKKDFDKKLEAIVIKDKGKKIFVEEFDQRLETTIKVRELNKKVSYRYLIRLELYKLEKHLMGEKEYQPYVSRW
ncbi:type I-B CRISPR-associated endonuclease Cas1b [Candidatus Contubernalis alkaliaceticus]|uniref:type I-B CRISPR-associated endonuclease Cas1b n=1 Tax=Candidatus Contubernalis alkaliaceticus TaxID=338645 RepID=UPI001F4BFD8A|nr:type I-B CRISPR-associated endonuclease Cas1b [Candidatus Contubernalis alkalaceticus]UNC93171.1 type I-B CRISPR-associated endonuclease Cas1 [Candidatus Contubernalis alkalaceticus]